MIDACSTNLIVKAWVESDVLVLQLVGTIDIFSSNSLKGIIRILERKEIAAVLLDMSMVSEVDVSGVEYLKHFEYRLKRMGGALRLYRVRPAIGKRLQPLSLSHQLRRARSWKGGLTDIRDEADPARLVPNSRASEIVGAIYTILNPPRKPMETKILEDRNWLRTGPSFGLHVSTTADNRQYYFYSSIASYAEKELVIFRSEPQVPINPGQLVTANFETRECSYQFQTEIIGLTELELTDGISVPLIRLIFPTTVSRRQNRYYDRINTELPAKLKDIDPEGTGRTFEGVIRDLSGGGCLLSAPRDLPGLTFINLSFQLSDGDSIDNVICRVNYLTHSDIGDSQLRIQFIKYEPIDRDRILQYIYLTQSEPAELVI